MYPGVQCVLFIFLLCRTDDPVLHRSTYKCLRWTFVTSQLYVVALASAVFPLGRSLLYTLQFEYLRFV